MSYNKYKDVLTYAKLSKLVYSQEFDFKFQIIKEHLGGTFLSWIEDKETSTQIGVVRYGGKTIIVFRGMMAITRDPREFFEDVKISADFKMTPYVFQTQVTKIHNGFLKAYLKVRDRIIASINGLTDNIVLTGHSLGGALAHICALDLKSDTRFKDSVVRCYTFGCPRVGDKEFMRLSDTNFRSLNVRNINDPVPFIPQDVFGYCSLGHELFVGDNLCFIKTLKAHKIDTYIEFLRFKLYKLEKSRDLKIKENENKVIKWWNRISINIIRMFRRSK